MNNLFIALMKKGIKPEQAAKVISRLLGCSERTARNKLKEVTDFSVTEAIKINEKIFDNNYEIGFLFRKDKSEKSAKEA